LNGTQIAPIGVYAAGAKWQRLGDFNGFQRLFAPLCVLSLDTDRAGAPALMLFCTRSPGQAEGAGLGA
jgi:hypothetical protein